MTDRRRNASGSRTSLRSALIQRMKASCTSILGVGHGAEHAVGDAHELSTQRLETGRCVLVAGARHHGPPSRGDLGGDGLCAGLALQRDRQTGRKPTAMRFHPLMTLTINVSLTCSSSRELSFRASRALPAYALRRVVSAPRSSQARRVRGRYSREPRARPTAGRCAARSLRSRARPPHAG